MTFELDRRDALIALGGLAAANLVGCGKPTPSDQLFPDDPNPADLTAVGELPPTEIPSPERFFGAADPVFTGPSRGVRSGLDTFDHVVVVMFENRAFDNLLGYLYPTGKSASGQPFNGVAGKNLSNPIPSYAVDASRGVVPMTKAVDLNTPIIDPSEPFQAVNLVLFNTFNPPSNQFVKDETEFLAPHNLPDGGGSIPPTLDGWVKMFIWTLQAHGGTPAPTYDEYSTIMSAFPPSLVPVFSQLAQAFGICDNYFCGVPTQTIPNRSFFHAAESGGTLINAPLSNWVGATTPAVIAGNTASTIFDSLTAAGRSWTVYYHEEDVISLTRLLHQPSLGKYPFAAPHFKTMKAYYDDVESGSLPDYAFIEPRLFFNDNSYHPLDGPTATKRGEMLLNDLYQALRQSNSPTGSNYQNTLLMVTFDEGGTCYDHVAPPAATPPHANDPGQFGFLFDRLGQRIPTLFISAYLDASTVLSTQYDSTSMLATLEKKFNLPALNARDAAATDFSGIFTRTTPRPRSEWPVLRVRKLTPTETVSNSTLPLNSLQTALVKLVYTTQTGADGFPPGITNVGDAITYITANTPP